MDQKSCVSRKRNTTRSVQERMQLICSRIDPPHEVWFQRTSNKFYCMTGYIKYDIVDANKLKMVMQDTCYFIRGKKLFVYYRPLSKIAFLLEWIGFLLFGVGLISLALALRAGSCSRDVLLEHIRSYFV